MSAIHSTGKDNSNADLIAMLSELDELDNLDEPGTGKAEVIEVKTSPTFSTDDLFSELLPLVAAPKSEVKKSEKEVIATLLGDIEDEIEIVTPPPAEEEPVIEAVAETKVEQEEDKPTEELVIKAAPEPAPAKREPAARRKRFSLDQLSDETMASLGFERKAFMDGYNACPVKAMDKVQNVMAWSQGLSDLSVYTIISVTHLVKTGSTDTAGFRLAMMSNPDKPYPSSTASAQAGQMMSILPVLGMATKDGKVLRINEESPLIKKFKSEAM
ncbi:hypothetical protein FVB40_28665 [Raoultella ornithinolytica]|uniref:hypothetical protein n=1 Tax=Raoultella ornithinolytica TaxID=54291 RepID=UPI000B5A8151|nr:hypothetical protein [Raoultella ornithinolytica]MTF12944.1 hypothetical protein [Raoultella ornithinolytica]OWY88162.1 hypothetical protein CAC00_09690 [Raoultella ornithinolytica]